MWAIARRPSVVAAVGLCIAALVFPQLAKFPEAHGALEFSALLIGAIVTFGLRLQHTTTKQRALMPPSFVIIFSALLLFGPNGATLVAAVGALTAVLGAPDRGHPRKQVFVDAVAVIAATQFSGLAYDSITGDRTDFSWPWSGVPLIVSVLAYHLARGGITEIAIPYVTNHPVNRAWSREAFRGFPIYLVGASVAVGLVEVLNHEVWEVLPVIGVSLFFLYRSYADYVARLEEEHYRREVIGAIQQGMSVVDLHGRITHWNDTAERILGCPHDRAMGTSLVTAVPLLGRTELPRAVQETLMDRRSRLLTEVRLPHGTETRILQVNVLPIAGGAALLWQDVTERKQEEQARRRTEERLALAAEAANDGLWEWDLRTQEFYTSGRWRSMVGLPARAGTTRVEDWLERVHPDDVAALRDALDGYVSGRTDTFQHEHRIRHEDGTYRRFLCRGLGVRGAGRRRDRVAGSLTDTTEQALAQERLRSVGFIDPLTGLFNRAVFVEGLGRRLDDFKLRRVNSWFAVLYLDLDRFKIVNDSLGHLVGDELLIAVSRRLESCVRPGDALARLGGDEFAVLLNGIVDDSQANAIAMRIQESLSAPFSIGGREVFTSASIGIAFGPAHYTNPDEMMRDADTAMYHAKSRGKARHEVFDADMHARVRDRLSLENDLRRAVAGNDFEVHYQPIVSLATGMCVGFESLVRWNRNGEVVSPAIFVPLAEELGLIEPLGTWVMQEACQTFAEWQRRYPYAGLDCITVNVSSRQLIQQNFFRVVQHAVESTGLRPADLRIEITETALMDSPGEAAAVLRDLRNFGVKVYLDDFGTGYSSLSHLHKLPVDALKIDRSFVRSLLLPNRPAIVESILALARTLNTSVVAEGIETHVEARELERLGCTHAQGFLFSRPLSTRAAEELVKAHVPLGPKSPTAEPELQGWTDPTHAMTRQPVPKVAGGIV